MKRVEHAARINDAWQKGVDAVIETGLRIINATGGVGARRVSRHGREGSALQARDGIQAGGDSVKQNPCKRFPWETFARSPGQLSTS